MPIGLSSPGRPRRRRLSWRCGDSSGPGAKRDRHDRHHRLRDGQPPERAEGPRERGPRGRDHLATRTGSDAPTKVVLPGVGAFADAIAELRRTGLGEAFRDAVAAGQALPRGLPRPATPLRRQRGGRRARGAGPPARPGGPLRVEPRAEVPHMGWNTLRVLRPSPLLAGLGRTRRSTSSTRITPAPTAPTTSSPRPTTRTRSRRSSGATT